MNLKLDLKELHDWPLAMKGSLLAVLLLALLALGYWFLISPSLSQYDRMLVQEKVLQERLAIKTQQQPDLKSEKAQLVSLKEKLAQMLKQLPNEQEIPDLVDQLARAAQKAKLTVESVKPLKLKQHQSYQLLPIAVSVKGQYPQIQLFIRQLSQMERIVEVGDFEMKPSLVDKPEELSMDMTVNIFIYQPLKTK